MKKLRILDVDGTIYPNDLHHYVLLGWKLKITIFFARSRFFFRLRYLLISPRVAQGALFDLFSDSKLFYDKKGLDDGIVIVTALPRCYFEKIIKNFNIEVYASRTLCRVIVKDLYDKKNVVYKNINQNDVIENIYSDRTADFSLLSKNNTLVVWEGKDKYVEIKL